MPSKNYLVDYIIGFAPLIPLIVAWLRIAEQYLVCALACGAVFLQLLRED